MNPEELAAIRKATEEATEGPWYASDYYNEIVPIMDDNGTIRRREDATFIANARTWVPQLLEYIESIRAAVCQPHIRPCRLPPCGELYCNVLYLLQEELGYDPREPDPERFLRYSE